MFTGGEENDLPRIENCGDTHGDGFSRNVFLAEEVGGRIPSRDGIEGDQACAGILWRAGLVEADVAASPDTQELQVDAAGLHDRVLVRLTGRSHHIPFRSAVGNVNVLGIHVDMGKEVLPHVAPVTIVPLRCHRVILVEVERHHV